MSQLSIKADKPCSQLELSRTFHFFYIHSFYKIRLILFFINDSQVAQSSVIENVFTNQLESGINDYNENRGKINSTIKINKSLL